MDPRPHKNHLVEVVNTPDVLLTKLIIKKITALDQISIIMSTVIVVDTAFWPGDDVQLRCAVSFINKFSLSPFLSLQ